MVHLPQERESGRRSLAVLIPAWQPDDTLVGLVAELRIAEFGLLLVVDDGSGAKHAAIFSELARFGVKVLRHAVNSGKGRALKTGMNCVLLEHPEIAAVLTADADGQHMVADMIRAADSFLQTPDRPLLGVRTFGKGVPLRSRFGNELTRKIFAVATGRKLADTQTGLRIFPRAHLNVLVVVEGERYEYEIAVLAHLCRNGQLPAEFPITTVYLENNRSSHFHPMWDSVRIYDVLIRRVLMRRLFARG